MWISQGFAGWRASILVNHFQLLFCVLNTVKTIPKKKKQNTKKKAKSRYYGGILCENKDTFILLVSDCEQKKNSSEI